MDFWKFEVDFDAFTFNGDVGVSVFVKRDS